jgi:hypothetical protein
MAKYAKEYGFSNVAIEDYPTGQTYQPVVGELWTTTPKNIKIFDIHDIPEALASTNANGDISAELVNVGQGTNKDCEGKDVKGKFVLSLAPNGFAATYNPAIEFGAIGVLGISAIGAGDRATDYANAIVWTTVNAKPNTAAWALSPKAAHETRNDAQPQPDGHHSIRHQERTGTQQTGNRSCRNTRRDGVSGRANHRHRIVMIRDVTLAPLGATTTPTGKEPTFTIAMTVLVDVLITATVLFAEFVTWTLVPLGVTASPNGWKIPPLTVAVTVLVAVLITETELPD